MKRDLHTILAWVVALIGAGTVLFVTVIITFAYALFVGMPYIDCQDCADLTGLRLTLIGMLIAGVISAAIAFWAIFTSLKN